jgi:tetratricopeptide (TPR) repeat protein
VLYLNRAMAYGNHAGYFRDRGDIYLRLKEYDKAIADLTQSLDLTPQDTEVLEARGSAYYRNGQLAQALADLDLAVKLDALDPDLLDLQSQILRKMGRTDEAVTDLQNALRFDTYNADLWYRKEWFLTNELQNHKEAVRFEACDRDQSQLRTLLGHLCGHPERAARLPSYSDSRTIPEAL